MAGRAQPPNDWDRGNTFINIDKCAVLTGLPNLPLEQVETQTSKPGEMAFMWRLVDPEMTPLERVKARARVLSGRSQQPKAGSSGQMALALDVDIMEHIFDAIPTLRDAVALSVTNGKWLAAGSRRVRELLDSTLQLWTGDRLIYVTSGSIRRGADGAQTALPEAWRGDETMQQEMQAKGGFARVVDGYAPAPAKVPRLPLSLSEITPTFDWTRFGGISLHDYDFVEPWAICSLSRREYVSVQRASRRSWYRSPVHTETDRNSSPRTNLILSTMYDLLAEMIRWSKDGEHGPWAGDRIKIATERAMRAGVEDWKDWKDVTKPWEGRATMY